MTDPKAALVALKNKYGTAPGNSLPRSAAADSTFPSASLNGSQGGGGTYGGQVTGSAEGPKNALAALKEKYTAPSSPRATGDIMVQEARKLGTGSVQPLSHGVAVTAPLTQGSQKTGRTRADVSNDIDALRLERQRLNGESMSMGILDPNDPQYDAKMQRDLAISLRVNEIAKEIEALENEDEALRKLEPGYGQNIFQRLWGGIKGGALNAAATNTDAARTGVETFVAGNAGDSYARYAQYAEWARQEYEKEVRKHGAGTERARWLQQEREKALEMGGQKLDDFYHSADNATVQRMANTADKLAAQSQAATEYAKSGASKASKLAVDLASQGVQMVPDAAANAVAPGAGLALMGVRSFGAGTQKARQAGADLAQQMGYGAASASVELLTEKMFDGLAGIYGKGFADGVVEGLVDKLAKGRLGPQAVKLISGMSEEAIEELVAGAVDPMLENLYDPKAFGTRYKDPDTYADIAYSMLIGGLMGGIGTGGQLLVNNVTGRVSGGQDGTGPENLTSPDVETETAASGAETTAINDNPAQHTAVEQRVIEEYKASVDQDLVGFVENARENKGGNSGRYEFKPVSDRAAADIKRLTGVDTTGFKTVMEQRAAEHILKRHGLSGKANQTMNDVNDIGRMQYVIDNYDSMEPGGKATSYTTIKKNGKPGTADTVKYVKAVDGTYYVCEAVPNTKAKTTFIVSAYLENRNADTTHPVLAENSPTSTAETADAYMSANMTIPQSAQNSKPKNLEDRGIIDGTTVPGYNRIIEMEGAVTDGRAQTGVQTGAQLDRAAGEGGQERPGVLAAGGALEGGRADGQGDIRVLGELRLTETQDKALYSRLLDEARTLDTQNGWAVTPKTAKDLADCKTFLSEDGGVGAAVAPDTDIIAVFKNKNRHPAKNAMRTILPEIIGAGGRKLDCYGERLAQMYAEYGGLVPVAKVAFDPTPGIPNPGWNESKGMPYIYVMMTTDTDPETVRQKQGSYHYWTDAELNALPLMEYDDAMAYRDRLLAEQHSYGREMARLKEAYKQVLAAYDAAADIDPEQAGARSEIKLARAILQSQYEAALTQAKASGDFSLANALYKELVRIQKLKQGDDR